MLFYLSKLPFLLLNIILKQINLYIDHNAKNMLCIISVIYYSGPRKAFLAQKYINGKSLRIHSKNVLPYATLGYMDLKLI